MASIDIKEFHVEEQEEGQARGSESPEVSPPIKLCRVCGDLAINCNFGVVSCESCKAFFRRNANNEGLLTSKCKVGCIITKGTRTNCKRCRLQKCFQEGMVKALILSEKQLVERRKKIKYNKKQKKKQSTSERDMESNKCLTFQDVFIQSCAENMPDEHLHEKIKNRLKRHCSSRLLGRSSQSDSVKVQLDDQSVPHTVAVEVVDAKNLIEEFSEPPTMLTEDETLVKVVKDDVVMGTEQYVDDVVEFPNTWQGDFKSYSTGRQISLNRGKSQTCAADNDEESSPSNVVPVATVLSSSSRSQTNSSCDVREISTSSGSLDSSCDTKSVCEGEIQQRRQMVDAYQCSASLLVAKNKVPCDKNLNLQMQPLQSQVHAEVGNESKHCKSQSIKKTNTGSILVSSEEVKSLANQCQNRRKRSLNSESELLMSNCSNIDIEKQARTLIVEAQIDKRQISLEDKEKKPNTENVNCMDSVSSKPVSDETYKIWSNTSVPASTFRETATADFKLPFASCFTEEVVHILHPDYTKVLVHLKNACSNALDKPLLGNYWEKPSLLQFFNQIEGLVPMYVAFAQCVQGFETFPLSVQIDLVKSSFVCFIGLYFLPRFDAVRQTFNMTLFSDDFQGTVPANSSSEFMINATRCNEMYDFVVNRLKCDTFILLVSMCFFLFSSNAEQLQKHQELVYWSQLYLQILIQYISGKYKSGEVQESDIDDFFLKMKQSEKRFLAVLESLDLACLKPMMREMYQT